MRVKTEKIRGVRLTTLKLVIAIYHNIHITAMYR